LGIEGLFKTIPRGIILAVTRNADFSENADKNILKTSKTLFNLSIYLFLWF